MAGKIVCCLKSGDARRKLVCGCCLCALLTLALAGHLLLAQASDPVRMIVYGSSTLEEACTQAIFPAFEQQWEAETGQDLVLEGLFGPSFTLAGQINLGAPADIALLSNAQHASLLQAGRRMSAETEPLVLGYTAMTIVTRPGNPAHIGDFGDLAQPGLQLVHAHPRSSGGGQWTVLAEYGSALLGRQSQAAAREQLAAIWRNVCFLAPSARAALTMFELGAGDALVTYEHDARLAQKRGIELSIVVPPRTIAAQHVAVIVDEGMAPEKKAVAQAFLDYLSGPGQEILPNYFIHPGPAPSHSSAEGSELFTVEELGGWSPAYLDIVDTLWQSEIGLQIDLEAVPLELDPGRD